jgi:diaminopimelate decarboxylase
MPMSQSFAERLFPQLPKIADYFGTPYHIYDAKGIKETGERLKTAFKDAPSGFREFYAVKALPNPEILKIMHELGFGFDCSSVPELSLARNTGAQPGDIMFTSNNTSYGEFGSAFRNGGCIVNLDDITFIDCLPKMPELICFRYNPGSRRTGNSIIGEPAKAKYGVTHGQIRDAYQKAKEKGAKRFGLHTMVCSNELNYCYMVETVTMLLDLTAKAKDELGIEFEFINMGGGLGIPYHPDKQVPLQLEIMAAEIVHELCKFREIYRFVPALYMESGRFMTGPHGVLVNQVIHVCRKYETYVGVEVGMPALMRPAMYDAYHHITLLDKDGHPPIDRPLERVHVVGSICENCDRLTDKAGRDLPAAKVGDFVVTHDTGAHGIAMGFNYNGRYRPQELLLLENGTVRLIRRAEDMSDLFRTLTFEPKELSLKL